MSEQQSEPTSAETGSVNAAANINTEPVLTESPAIAPDQELTSPKTDAAKAEPKADAPRVEAPKVEAKAGTKTEATRAPSNVMIMAPGARSWSGEDARVSRPPASMRRVAAMVAVIGFAAVAGAVGGALATSDIRSGKSAEAAAGGNAGLEAAIARIDADILALKASVEQNARLGTTQFNKTSDRLDKVEKSQTEPAARLARLSDEVSKLRATQAAAPAQLAAAAPATTTVPKDVTGSVAPPATAVSPQASPGTPAKPEIARLPTVEGWVLRDVGHGGALIESRRGVFEIYAGDSIPGVGRVDAIRKQDGRWVVVTSRGLIVSR
ncbi:MAG: hypothetical protein U1E61_12770 [Bradyrhizobium sp.]